MNPTLVVCVIGIFFLILQIIFCTSCLRWLASGKRKRDKEFALLDADRAKLMTLQNQLKHEVSEGRKLADDTLKKLKIIGTEAHAEWEEMTKKINSVLQHVNQSSESILHTNLSALNTQKLSVEKSIADSRIMIENLKEKITHAERIFKLFDKKIPVNEILKDIQISKYDEAKKMLHSGIEASIIAKKLGMSLGEIALLTSF